MDSNLSQTRIKEHLHPASSHFSNNIMTEEEAMSVPAAAAVSSATEVAIDGDDGGDVSPADGPMKSSTSASDPSSTNPPYALSSTVSRNHCIIISFVILLAHGLFLWGQLDLLWAQYVSYSASGSVSVDNITSTFIADRINNVTSIGINQGNTNDPYLVGEWSYGGMLNELWVYSKVTAVVLFLFSAFWPHLKLVLLHVYFYRPIPSKPRRAALYWLDAVGKMSLADVCATCMIFLLLNFQATIQLSDVTSQLSGGLLAKVGPFIAARIPDGTLSNETQKILDDITVLAYDEVVNLSQSIFINEDPKIYMALLEEGCAKFRNGGESCNGTSFYEPSSIRSKAQVITKCLPIRNKCRQCECLVNEVIYNQLIPGQVVEEKIGDAVSWTFAKLLAFIKSGNNDFASWFSAEGQFEMKSEVFAYPAFVGFTVAVIVSICASLMVDEVEMKDSMKRLNGGATNLSEALDNSGVDNDKRSLLFGFNEEGSVKKWTSRIPAILAGLCIVPIVFMAIYVKMFNWTTEGLLEQLLFMQVSAINFYYSIIDCVKKVNNGTGYGWAFTVLYGVFMLGTPMLRATLLLVITVIPMSPLWHLRIAKMSNHVGSFIGWEPFFICVIIMAFELPHLTGESVSPETCNNLEDRFGITGLVAKFGLDANTCFIMYFYIMAEFALIIVAWVCLTTFNAAAWKITLKKYDPFGTCKEEGELLHLGGPYLFGCKECCYCDVGCKKKDHGEKV